MTNKRKGRLIFDKARKLLYNVDEVDQKMYGIIQLKYEMEAKLYEIMLYGCHNE